MIHIQIRRDDGDVLKLEGVAAVAVTLQNEVTPQTNLRDIDPPVVSLRCDSPEQLTVILAALIAMVEMHAGPLTVAAALELAPAFSAKEPAIRRRLPPR
jgi:hypothetical protein